MGKPFPKDSVCKPCWELKYCPYGYLVEYSPHFHPTGDPEHYDTTKRYEEVKAELKEKGARTEGEVHEYFTLLNMLDPESNSYVSQFSAEDVGCRVFGHVCPIFLHQSGATETRGFRRDGRRISWTPTK